LSCTHRSRSGHAASKQPTDWDISAIQRTKSWRSCAIDDGGRLHSARLRRRQLGRPARFGRAAAARGRLIEEDGKISNYQGGNGPDYWSGSQQPYGQQPQYPEQQPQYPEQQSPYGQQYSAPPYQDQYGSQYQQPYDQSQYQQPAAGYDQSQYQQPGAYPGQPYSTPGASPYGQPRRGSKAPFIILGVVAGVLVLACALTVTLVRLGSSDDDRDGDRAAPFNSPRPTAAPSAPPTGTTKPPAPTNTTANPSEESVEGDLDRYKTGDCLTITGADNTVEPAKCTDAGAYKVLLRRDGTIDDSVCDSTDATDVLWQDSEGVSDDLVLCIAKAR
jgi:hypothetical protein